MSYHVTIIRSKGTQIPITLEEAANAAGSMEGWRYFTSPPTFEFQGKEGTCTLWYQDGELWTQNPDKWQIEVMVDLANRLDARVRGDEWETYKTSNKTFRHPDDAPLRKEAEARSKALLVRSMREQRLIRNAIVGLFVVLGVAGYLVGKWLEQR